MSRPGEVHIGNAQGLIALWLTADEAIDIAEHYGPSDAAYRELLDAVEQAYPHRDTGGRPPLT